MKKVTLVDVIERKKKAEEEGKDQKLYYYESKELGGPVEIIKKDLSVFMNLMESMDEDGATTMDMINTVLFEFLTMFRDSEENKQAMEVYGVATPMDLPAKVFNENMGEMTEIQEIIIKMYGLDTMADDIKN